MEDLLSPHVLQESSFFSNEIITKKGSSVTHFFNKGKIEDLLSPPVLQGSSFLSNEINTKSGQVSLIFSTGVKSKTYFSPCFTGVVFPL